MRPERATQAIETPVSQQTDQSEQVSSIELPDAVLRWEAQMIEAGRETLPFSVHHLAHVLANTKKIQSKTRRRRARGGSAEVGGLQQLGPQVVAAVVREGIIPDFIIEWRTLFMKIYGTAAHASRMDSWCQDHARVWEAFKVSTAISAQPSNWRARGHSCANARLAIK